jgi:hypothetical protein
MLVPLYGFLRGDTVGLLVLVHDHDTVADAAASLVQAASVRVRPTATARVVHDGDELDPRLTIAQAGLRALDRIDVIPEEA